MTTQTTDDLVRKGYMIPGMMWPTEMHKLALFIRDRQITSYAEIGTFCGRSLWAAACGMRSGYIYAQDDFSSCLDHVPDDKFVNNVLIETVKALTRLGQIRLNIDFNRIKSFDTSAALTAFDCVFIDADHSQEMVARDILAWWSRVKPGGYMIGHDYSPEFPGVMNTVNDVFQGKHETIPDTRFWFLRKLEWSEKAVEEFRNRT